MMHAPAGAPPLLSVQVAAVKVHGDSEVAGKATVFVFPDLNTGTAGEGDRRLPRC